MRNARRSDLSPALRGLVDLIRLVGFGSVEDLEVVDGEPVLDPPPKVVRVIKLRDAGFVDPRRDHTDYILKIQVIQLLAYIREIDRGTIRRIEVQDGLPFKVIVEGLGVEHS